MKGKEGMEPDDLLCSRNARSGTPLVGRAQWKINQAPSRKRERASLEGSSVPSLDGRSQKLLTPLLGWALNSKSEYEWMCAVKDILATPPHSLRPRFSLHTQK